MFPTVHSYAHFLRVWLTVLALFAAGPACATFAVNGDGTVSDSVTLLTWDQCSWGQSGSACAGSASEYTWAAALGVAVAARAAHYKGHNDWRLPNVVELESLVKRDTYDPAIDSTAFPNTPSGWYWSSTIQAPDPAYAWVVCFYDGNTSADCQSNGRHVRLVRSGQSFSSFDRQSPRTAQTIAFGTAPLLAVGGAATLSATASSGLPVTFNSLTASICTVSGNTVTGVAVGTCTVAANQAGNSSTNPAAQVTQSFSIGKSSQTISFVAAPSSIVVGGTGSVSATASSGLPITFSSLTLNICTVSGTTVTGVAVGTCTIAANQAGNSSTSPAAQVTQSFSSAIPVLRKAIEFYQSTLKHYFITLDAGEAAGIDAGAAGPGWTRTGGSFNVWSAPASGSQPVCRFYGSFNPGPNSHFFTVNADECAALRAQQAITPETVKKWHYEGIAFYSAPPLNAACAGGTMPVYRYYNKGYARGEDSNHRLTTDLSQRAKMEADGWGYEGVVMCAEQGSGGEGGGGDGGGGGGGGGD